MHHCRTTNQKKYSDPSPTRKGVPPPQTSPPRRLNWRSRSFSFTIRTLGTSLGQDGSDWSRDLATLTFDLGGHGACGFCGSSSSICIPSLKFVGLAFRKIWCTMCVSINGPGDFDLLTLKLVYELHQRWETFLPNLGMLGLWVLELFTKYVMDRRIDRRTKATLIAPFHMGGGIITDYQNAISLFLWSIRNQYFQLGTVLYEAGSSSACHVWLMTTTAYQVTPQYSHTTTMNISRDNNEWPCCTPVDKMCSVTSRLLLSLEDILLRAMLPVMTVVVPAKCHCHLWTH